MFFKELRLSYAVYLIGLCTSNVRHPYVQALFKLKMVYRLENLF